MQTGSGADLSSSSPTSPRSQCRDEVRGSRSAQDDGLTDRTRLDTAKIAPMPPRDVIVSASYESGQVVLQGRDATYEQEYPDLFYIPIADEAHLPPDWRGRVGEPMGDYLPVMIPPGRGPRMERLNFYHQTVFEPAGVRMLEADVSPVQRFLLEHPKIQIAKDWRCFYFDLETEEVKNWERPWQSRILSFSWRSSHSGRKGHVRLEALTDDAERKLLRTLVALIHRHEVALAWNGDNFDFKVVRGRCELLDVELDWYGTHWLDMLGVHKRYMTRGDDGAAKSSLKLNDVARSLLGKGKVPIEERARELGWDGRGLPFTWVWRHAPELMKEYNDEDVELMVDIEAKTGFVALHFEMCDLCRVFPGARSLFPSVLVDGRMLQVGRTMNYRFPSKPGEIADDFTQAKGAYVPEAITGLHESVAVVDYARMYPSIILMGNMSVETLLPLGDRHDQGGSILIPETDEQGELTGASVARFRKDRVGLLPQALRALITLRKQFKKAQDAAEVGSEAWASAGRKSTACKVAANTFYGVVLSPYSRYFVKEIGESVTSFGRLLLASTLKTVRARGHRFVFGDTDSVAFVATDAEAEAVRDEVNATMVPALVEKAGGFQGEISVGYEKRFRRIVVTASKRYAGTFAVYDGKPVAEGVKPDIRGLEMVRADQCPAARHLQRAVVGMVLGGKTPQEIARMVNDERDRLWAGDVKVEDLVITKSLSTDIEDYKSKPQHVMVAERMRELGMEARAGTRVSFVMTLAGPVHPSELDPGKVDRFTYWNKHVYPATQRVLACAFPEQRWEGLLFAKNASDPRQPNLFAANPPQLARARDHLVIRTVEVSGADTTLSAKVGEDLLRAFQAFPGALPVLLEIPVRNSNGSLELVDLICPQLVANPGEDAGLARTLRAFGHRWSIEPRSPHDPTDHPNDPTP